MNKYIVTVTDPDVRLTLAQRFEKVGQPTTLHTVLIVTTASSAQDLLDTPGVVSVEPEGFAEPCQAQIEYNGPMWGLHWISRSAPYQNDKTGEGVDIYILDTGIRDTHTEFEGRVRNLYSHDDVPYAVTGGPSPFHGTAVASCAGGTLYGTAKGATLVNCRIDFSFTEIVKALDTILADHLQKDASRPSILNFSGASSSPLIGQVFSRLVEYGVVVIAASGNDSAMEPKFPAKAEYVEGVGALNMLGQPAVFSNRKVSVWAPGDAVQTAHVFSDTSSVNTAGTSFAGPYYSGLLACILQGSHRFNTWQQVTNFTFAVRRQLLDTNRVAPFDNGGYSIGCVNTRNFGRQYYSNPSFEFSDHEINQFCADNLHQPQVIADACWEYNVDLNRLVRATRHSDIEINQFFANACVKPWWV